MRLEAVLSYAVAFGLTWVIESIVYLWAFRMRGWSGAGGWTVGRVLVIVLGLNVATHPWLWWFTLTRPGLGALMAAEALVVVVEGALIAVLRRRSDEPAGQRWAWAFLAALLANSVSLLVGLLA